MRRSIKIKDFVLAVNYKIGDGYEYLWECYGPNACGLGWDKKDFSASAAIIYDTKTHDVYEMSVWDCRVEKTKVYRWIKPGYFKKYKKESKSRGFKFDIAIDDVKFEDVSPSSILKNLKILYNSRKRVKSPKWID